MLTAASLVRKGFLPRELPPPFTSEPLATLFAGNPNLLPLGTGATECVRHNLARTGGFRRPLKLPNPRSYIALAQALETYWQPLIEPHLKSQTLSLSSPAVTRTRERAVRPRYQIGQTTRLRARDWRSARFVLYADVSQFYSSLYTHAIPWALHTKAVAKAQKGRTDGDKIDKAVRNCSGAQTVGIPIGPDTSFVVAEVVLTAVDSLLRKALPTLRGFRYFDDYEVAFPTRAEAEEAQGHLESALGDFELVVNPYKTRIFELPHPFDATWKQELAAFPIRAASRAQTNDTIAFFSLAAELAQRHAGALLYALRKSNGIGVSSSGWPIFEGLVWSVVSNEPTTMAFALDLLRAKAAQAGRRVRKRAASEVIEALIERNAPVRNGSEVAWALWAALLLDVRMTANAATAVSSMDDDFVALLALDADSRGLFPVGALDKSGWETLVKYTQVLRSDHWLLAYEGTRKGWLKSAASRVQRDAFFSVLLANGISFYDPRPARQPFTGPAAPIPGAPLPDSYF